MTSVSISTPEPTATDLLTEVAEMRGMIQGHTIRQDAVNGSAPAPAGRPYWQDRPCPPWCMLVVPHQDHDLPEDRYHLAPSYDVTLTLEAADVIRIPSEAGRVAMEVSPSFLAAGLAQGWRDREGHIFLTHAGTHDIKLTIGEAGELAEALSSLVRQAKGQQ